MKLRKNHPILICIDLQLGFLEEDYWGGNRNNKDAEKICSEINGPASNAGSIRCPVNAILSKQPSKIGASTTSIPLY